MNSIKLIIAIVIIVWLNNPLTAQPNINDSTEAYQYWAQRGIIEMVYAYMNDYIEAVGELKAKNEIIGKDKYEQQFISGIDHGDLPNFETISFLLKNNGWTGAEKTILQPLLKNLTDSIPLNQDFFFNTKRNISQDKKSTNLVLIDFINKDNNDINKRFFWKKRGNEIIDEYEKKLSVLGKKVTLIEGQLDKGKESRTNSTSIPINVVEENVVTPNSEPKYIYLIVFVLGILIGSWLVFFISKRKIYSILRIEKDSYLYDLKLLDERFIFKYLGLIYILWQSKEDYKTGNKKREIKTLQDPFVNQIEELQKENSELNQTILDNTEQKLDPQSIDKMNPPVLEIKQPEKKTKKLFFTMPENDGRFIIENGEASNDGRKYFRIEFQESSEQGVLYFIPGERDKRAINRLESYLKPACEIENIISADSATRIEFLSPGKVVLINDSWVIDTDNKAKVKLI